MRTETEFQSGTHPSGRRPGSHIRRGLDCRENLGQGQGREADKRYRDLCRRLGIGMLGVSANGDVSIIVGSVSPMPRTNPKRRSRLMREHQTRRGDPALGGSTRMPVMTAYRQNALACAAILSGGPARVGDVRKAIPDAGKILLSNVYGWFERVERGVYGLTDAGREALRRWPQGTRAWFNFCNRTAFYVCLQASLAVIAVPFKRSDHFCCGEKEYRRATESDRQGWSFDQSLGRWRWLPKWFNRKPAFRSSRTYVSVVR